MTTTTRKRRPSVTSQRDALLDHVGELHGILDWVISAACLRMDTRLLNRSRQEQERSLAAVAAALGIEPETLRKRR